MRSARTLVPRAAEAELRHWVLNNLTKQEDGHWTWRSDPRLRRPGTPGPRPDPSTLHAIFGKVACPTLVVRGAESEMYEPDQAEEVARAIPNARVVHIPSAGHWVPLDNPGVFLMEVRDFLAAA